MPKRSRGWFTNSRFTTKNSRTFFFPPAHYCIYVSCSASEEAYAQEIARLAHTAEGRARLEYMKERFQIDEADFLTFDAMRQVCLCSNPCGKHLPLTANC